MFGDKWEAVVKPTEIIADHQPFNAVGTYSATAHNVLRNTAEHKISRTATRHSMNKV